MRSYFVNIVLTWVTLTNLSGGSPTELQKRALGDRAEPYQVHIDCSGAEAVCNADCYVIHCLGAPNPVQYEYKSGDDKRAGSGYTWARQLLRAGEQRRRQFGISIAESILQRLGRSPEETIMANTAQAGEGEIIIPVIASENTSKCMTLIEFVRSRLTISCHRDRK
jgi:hypothetical protein